MILYIFFVYSFDWLIDFNGMSTHLELFYGTSLRNHVHSTFIFICLISCLLKVFFSYGPIEYK